MGAQNNNDRDTQQTMVNPVEVQKFLKNLDYPANKDEIIDKAREEGADENVIDTLQKLPDREYNGPNAISDELGDME